MKIMKAAYHKQCRKSIIMKISIMAKIMASIEINENEIMA
jgi:hypothetical protein